MPKDTDAISFYAPGERLLLLYHYLLENSSRDNVLNVKTILNHLSNMNIDISAKTLYIDFARLRDVGGLNVVYDARRHGYYVDNPAFEPNELRLLVDSIQSAKFLTQDQARQLTRKVGQQADVHTRAVLNRQAFVTNRIHSMNESVVKGTDSIHECISSDRQMGFRYFHYTPSKERMYSKSGKQYIVSPFALLWNDGYYYLYAYVPEYGEFRHFRIDRMERIMKLPLKREGKELFKKIDLNTRQTKIFNMYGGGQEYRVQLRCNNRMADAIIDRFGKDTTMIPSDEQHFTAYVDIEASEQFYAWAASFGDRLQILSPAAVRNEMRTYIENIAKMYRDD